ncbi:helix-turn-helix domain-containing protein [Leifsonia lichenia]
MADSENGAPRQYRSTLREEQARQTRQRILASAFEVFSAKGYTGASLADIAAGAGVSVESVKVHGPKRALLLGAFELAFAGSAGDESLSERPEVAAIMAIEDTGAFLTAMVGLIAEANARTSGLWAAFLAAAAEDTHVGDVLASLLERRHADYRRMVGLLAARGAVGAPSDDALQHLADVLSFLMSPEGHQQLVQQSGWTFERYRDWLIRTVSATVAAGA